MPNQIISYQGTAPASNTAIDGSSPGTITASFPNAPTSADGYIAFLVGWELYYENNVECPLNHILVTVLQPPNGQILVDANGIPYICVNVMLRDDTATTPFDANVYVGLIAFTNQN